MPMQWIFIMGLAQHGFGWLKMMVNYVGDMDYLGLVSFSPKQEGSGHIHLIEFVLYFLDE